METYTITNLRMILDSSGKILNYIAELVDDRKGKRKVFLFEKVSGVWVYFEDDQSISPVEELDKQLSDYRDGDVVRFTHSFRPTL